MASVPLVCENAELARESLLELKRNGWEMKSHALAPHVTDFAPNGVPGYKKLTVIIRKVNQVVYFVDGFNNRHALPGEMPPAK